LIGIKFAALYYLCGAKLLLLFKKHELIMLIKYKITIKLLIF